MELKKGTYEQFYAVIGNLLPKIVDNLIGWFERGEISPGMSDWTANGVDISCRLWRSRIL